MTDYPFDTSSFRRAPDVDQVGMLCDEVDRLRAVLAFIEAESDDDAGLVAEAVRATCDHRCLTATADDCDRCETCDEVIPRWRKKSEEGSR